MLRQSLTDAGLIEALCAGCETTTDDFVRRVRPRLETLARFRGFSAEDAEEIAQDTLLAVLTQLRAGRFERRSQLTSWVRAIFDRRAVDHHRKVIRHGRRTVSIEQLPRGEVEDAGGLIEAGDTATRVLVRSVLASLRPHQRLILLLNAQDGLSAREIAPMLRLGAKTTEALLTEAKKQFRTRVAAERAQESLAARRLMP
jgi:RNA polymerase sigma factor (sigma-70 family)